LCNQITIACDIRSISQIARVFHAYFFIFHASGQAEEKYLPGPKPVQWSFLAVTGACACFTIIGIAVRDN